MDNESAEARRRELEAAAPVVDESEPHGARDWENTLERLDHNLDDLRSDDEEPEPEGDDDA